MTLRRVGRSGRFIEFADGKWRYRIEWDAKARKFCPPYFYLKAEGEPRGRWHPCGLLEPDREAVRALITRADRAAMIAISIRES